MYKSFKRHGLHQSQPRCQELRGLLHPRIRLNSLSIHHPHDKTTYCPRFRAHWHSQFQLTGQNPKRASHRGPPFEIFASRARLYPSLSPVPPRRWLYIRPLSHQHQHWPPQPLTWLFQAPWPEFLDQRQPNSAETGVPYSFCPTPAPFSFVSRSWNFAETNYARVVSGGLEIHFSFPFLVLGFITSIFIRSWSILSRFFWTCNVSHRV